MRPITEAAALDYRPSFPASYRPGIGIVGCGQIVKAAHLPAYRRYGLKVVGAYDPSPAATQGIEARYGVQRVFAGLDELLGDPQIEVVDIATGPAVRVELIRRALAAGKHVLAQKPLTADPGAARAVIEEADRAGLRLAVNQNGRWSPAWRVATLLVQDGAVGDVVAVTHLYDRDFRFLLGTPFDRIDHLVLFDYAMHWFDITRCWLEGKDIVAVRAQEHRTPNQPAESEAPWGAWAMIEYGDGSSAMLRSPGCSESRPYGHPFWIHGTRGTMRGTVIGASAVAGPEHVELERDGVTSRFQLEGRWNPEGFAGAMGELLTAIAEDREPYNSARHNLLSLQMSLAACRSAEAGARPVTLDEVT